MSRKQIGLEELREIRKKAFKSEWNKKRIIPVGIKDVNGNDVLVGDTVKICHQYTTMGHYQEDIYTGKIIEIDSKFYLINYEWLPYSSVATRVYDKELPLTFFNLNSENIIVVE